MFKKLSLVVFVAMVLSISGNLWAVDPPIINETATASGEDPFSAYYLGGNSEGRLAIKAVDNSGLDVTGLLHDMLGSNMWLTDEINEVSNPGTVAGPAWLRIEFPYVYNVESMWIWNYNQDGPAAGRGMKNVTIEYSVTGGAASTDWTTIGTPQLTIGLGTADYAGFAGPSFGGVDVKYVVITADAGADGHWGYTNEDNCAEDANYPCYVFGTKLYGLSEVKFFGTTQFATIPSPTDGQLSVDPNGLLLSWQGGDAVTAHDIYWGTDETEVTAATRGSNPNVTLVQNHPDSNYPATLEYGTQYYWKVDEVSGGTPQWFGETWSFKIMADFGTKIIPSHLVTATASSTAVASGIPQTVGDGTYGAIGTVNEEGLDPTGLLHSNIEYDGWSTADVNDADTEAGIYDNPNPGTVSGPAWIRCEFDKIAHLTGLWVWNGVGGGYDIYTKRGMRLVTVEYSLTGGSNSSEWTKLNGPNPDGTYEFTRGIGYTWNPLDRQGAPNPQFNATEYKGFEGPAFGGVDAKYVVITANDVDGNWGDLSEGMRKYMLAELRFYGVIKWATWPDPADGSVRAEPGDLLSWTVGSEATGHDVYIGTDAAEVAAATRTSNANVTLSQNQPDPNYTPSLELSTTYYWRVDEVNASSLPEWTGDVWMFRVVDVLEGHLAPENFSMVSAYSSLYQTDPNNTINGSGMDTTWRYHSNDYLDMWISVNTGSTESYNAGTVSGPTWIAYKFDKVYELAEFYIWNYNEYHPSDATQLGMKNVTIQYSTTGGTNSTDWTTLTSSTIELVKALSPASGHNVLIGAGANPNIDATTMAKTETLDFGGAEAQYVVITPNSGLGNGWWGPLTWYLGLSEVRFHYVADFAIYPSPRHQSTGVLLDTVLSWTKGNGATTHTLYFGTDPDALDMVATLSAGTETFDPNDPDDDLPILKWDTTYYWSVDEYDGVKTTGGSLWSFTTNAVVDDMEGTLNFSTSANGTVTLETEPNFVNAGIQSLKLDYDNSAGSFYSEVTAASTSFPVGSDWAIRDLAALDLLFAGTAGNSKEQLYLALDDGTLTKVVEYDGDSNNLADANWTTWHVDLADFSDQGINLSSIDNIYIGLGDSTSPSAGGIGTLYIDEIKLYTRRCLIDVLRPAGDIVGKDCYVGSDDLKAMTDIWTYDIATTSVTDGLVAYYTFDDGTTVNSGSAGAAANGTLVNEATIENAAGMGKVLNLTGSGGVGDDYMNIGGAGAGSWSDTNDFTITMYAKAQFDSNTVEYWSLGGKISTEAYPASVNTWYLNGYYDNYLEYKTYGGLSQPSGNAVRFDLPNDQQWHHLAFTYSDTNATAYLEGTMVASLPSAQPRTYGLDETWIGAIKRWPGEVWIGMIDEVRFYDRVLTEAEIAVIGGGSLVADLDDNDKVDFADYAILTLDYLKDPLLWP